MTSSGRRAAHGAVTLVVCLSACARPATTAAPVTTASTSGSASDGVVVDDLVAADGELARALATGASCDALAALRDRVCRLAEHLCALSSASPDDVGMRAQCEDGATRCLSATEGVRNRCGP